MWSFAGPGLPIGWLLVALIGVPLVVAGFFGAMTFRRTTPLVFRCAACGRTFERKPWRRWASRCPRCGSAAWNG